MNYLSQWVLYFSFHIIIIAIISIIIIPPIFWYIPFSISLYCSLFEKERENMEWKVIVRVGERKRRGEERLNRDWSRKRSLIWHKTYFKMFLCLGYISPSQLSAFFLSTTTFFLELPVFLLVAKTFLYQLPAFLQLMTQRTVNKNP